MKTVVQQIIEKFEHIQKNDCKTLAEVVFFDAVLSIMDNYLETEKQQIIDAYDFGIVNDFYISENYFIKTFNTTNKENLK